MTYLEWFLLPRYDAHIWTYHLATLPRLRPLFGPDRKPDFDIATEKREGWSL